MNAVVLRFAKQICGRGIQRGSYRYEFEIEHITAAEFHARDGGAIDGNPTCGQTSGEIILRYRGTNPETSSSNASSYDIFMITRKPANDSCAHFRTPKISFILMQDVCSAHTPINYCGQLRPERTVPGTATVGADAQCWSS